MFFNAEKDPGIIPKILTQILDGSVNGITLSDPDLEDNPIVYANKAFETMTGYTKSETTGRNCRFLQGEERNQPELEQIRDAIKQVKPVEVTLRNFRKNGELFYNRLSITPLLDSQGNLIYFLGVQHDVTELVEAKEENAKLMDTLEKMQHE